MCVGGGMVLLEPLVAKTYNLEDEMVAIRVGGGVGSKMRVRKKTRKR